MRVGYYQYCPGFHSPTETLAFLEARLQCVEADLLVLPELAVSGYLFKDREAVRQLSETVPGPSSETFCRLADRTGCAFVYGYIERVGPLLYNSALFAAPGGVLRNYRKTHLFNTEKGQFYPGDDEYAVFDYKGASLGMLVCFDHMFPEAARSLALQGVEIVCHPSNLVLEGYAQLTTRVRSMENRIFWILANRTGTEKIDSMECTFTGASQITSPSGAILAASGRSDEELVIIDIEPSEADNKRVSRSNDILIDRRTELYRC